MRQLIFSFFLFVFFANCILAQPLMLYTTQASGYANTIVDTYIDAQGATISYGVFSGTTDFDPGPGVSSATPAGAADIFVVKLNSGGQLQWVKTIPSAPFTTVFPSEMKTDAAGNIFITGDNAYTTSFVTKLDINGNIQWTKTFAGQINSNSIDVDASGNSYTCGHFTDTVDFDPGPGTHLLSAVNNAAFYMKLDPNGNLVWVNSFANSLNDNAVCLRLDESHNKLYVTGSFNGTNVDVDHGSGTNLINSNGSFDAYVLQTDLAGNFQWVYEVGGSNYDVAQEIGISPDHNLYLLGSLVSDSVDFDPGPGISMHFNTGTNRGFIVKLNETGNFSWFGDFTGIFPTAEYNLAFDAQSQVYVSGHFIQTADLDPGPGVSNFTPAAGNANNAYVERLDPSNGNLLAIQILGGLNPFSCGVYDLEIDAAGFIFLSGTYTGTGDFDMSTDSLYSVSSGNNFFLLRSGLLMNIEENPAPLSFSLYPNPGNGIFTLVLPSGTHHYGTMRITDLRGRIVYSEDLETSGSGTERAINLGTEASGMYVMEIEIDKRPISQKLLIQR